MSSITLRTGLVAAVLATVASAAILLHPIERPTVSAAGVGKADASRSTSPVLAARQRAVRTLQFESNLGQAGADVRFVAHGPDFRAEVFDDGLRLSRRAASSSGDTETGGDASARLRFVGGKAVAFDAREPAAGLTHYLRGNDASKWLRDVPSWRQLRQAAVYPGIDLVYYGREDALEYDLVVKPGAKPAAIRIAVDSDAAPTIDAGGDLLLDGAKGRLRMHRPVAYQTVDGTKRPVEGRYVMRSRREVGFEVGGYDHGLPLVIDPTFKLLYATYLGGVHDDQVDGIALDAQNNAFVVGNSGSEDFPVSGNAYQATRKAIGRYVRNVVVTKFDASGQLIYSTFIGGTTNDYGVGIAVDANGRATFTGNTNSPDFPVTANAYQTAFRGNQSAYLATLSSDGASLSYSTFYGGNGGASGSSVVLEASGTALVAGSAGPGLPTTAGAYKTSLATGNGAFVARFDTTAAAAAQLLAATYYGTDAPQTNFLTTGNLAYVVALDAAGSPWITGQAYTPNLPVSAAPAIAPPPAMTSFCSGGSVALNSFAYVAHLSADLKSLVYASYLTGNTGGPSTCAEYGFSIAFDATGNVYVGGSTSSLAYPTTAGVPQPTSPANSSTDGYTGFITKMKADGSAILWSTYLGGNAGRTYMRNLVFDSTGALWMHASSAGGSNFPITPDALQATNHGGFDLSFTRLDPATAAVQYSTFLGGAGDDFAGGFAFDRSGNAYFAGVTVSANFPVTADAFQPAITPNAYDGADWTFGLLGSGTIGSVRPATSANTGDATLHISGVGIVVGATADLVAADGSTIAAVDFSIDADGGGATLVFPLDGKAVGSYALRITNSDGSVLRRDAAFSIGAASPPVLSAQVIGRAKIRTGVAATYQIVVTNSGGQDALAIPLWLTMPDGLTPAFDGRTATATALATQSEGGTTYLYTMLPKLAAGETATLPLVVTAATDMASIPITATLQAPWFATRADLYRELLGDGSVAYAPDCVSDGARPGFSNCYGTYLQYGQAKLRPLAGAGQPGTLSPKQRALLKETDPCKVLVDADAASRRGEADGKQDANDHTPGKHYNPPDLRTDTINAFAYNGGYTSGTLGAAAGGSGGAAHAVQPGDPRNAKPAGAPPRRLAADFCPVPPVPTPPPPIEPSGSGGGGSGGSIDPNDKIGPRGDGSASHFIRADAPLSYQVQFENVATASLPAANVVVTDQLDPAKVDLSTFELGSFSFGSTVVPVPSGLKSYATTVAVGTDLAVRIQGSVDVTTGLARWTFTTLDPATHLPPSDPTLGFLPPDSDGTKGQGAVNFTVRQKAGTANGTVYSNLASIVFDANAAIVTPTWVNTVDTSLPASHVTALAGRLGTTEFDVTWSGSDSGSGVGAYTVYVSDNGGAYGAWQTAVKTTTAVYAGSSGHTYAFYVRSSDGAGNSEPAKTTAEQSIAVSGAFVAPGDDDSGGGGGCTIGGDDDGRGDPTLPLAVIVAGLLLAIGRRRAARTRRTAAG